jgi:hypothetical protein
MSSPNPTILAGGKRKDLTPSPLGAAGRVKVERPQRGTSEDVRP